MRPPTNQRASGERLSALLVLTVVAFAIRAAWIVSLPDIDCDAYGHFAAGRAVARDPSDLDVHWVWLPGYHFLVALWTKLGLGFTALRLLSSTVQAIAPLLLHRWLRSAAPGKGAPTRDATAFLAAALFTVAPLSNALAVSAQAETLFTCLIVGAAVALHERRFVVAAALLSVTTMMRYEAWGAVAAVAVWIGIRRPGVRSLVAVAAPAAIVLAWILTRRLHDGAWLVFLTETRAFAGGLRGTTETSSVVEAIRLPLLVPLAVFGPALAFAVVGLRRATRMDGAAFAPALGVAAFLLASYVGRGALAGERYFTSLTPFVCVLVALGVDAIAARVRRPHALPVFAGVAAAAVAATTAAHLGRNAGVARANEATLRADEARVSE